MAYKQRNCLSGLYPPFDIETRLVMHVEENRENRENPITNLGTQLRDIKNMYKNN